MKNHIIPACKLTIICLLFIVGVYTLFIWATGLLIAPEYGDGETMYYTKSNLERSYGYTNIGQSFTHDNYFWSRPSAIGYNAAGSGASNKGPTNPEYLALVQSRIDTFLIHNPGVNKSNIPVEMVTASGSGLDPNISPKAAAIQIQRIAKERGVSVTEIQQLVTAATEKPLFGLFGPERINVLKLNNSLDNQFKSK